MKIRKMERVIPVEAVRLTEKNMVKVVQWLGDSGLNARIGRSTSNNPVLWCGMHQPGRGGSSFAIGVGGWVVLDGHSAWGVRHKYFKQQYRDKLDRIE